MERVTSQNQSIHDQFYLFIQYHLPTIKISFSFSYILVYMSITIPAPRN